MCLTEPFDSKNTYMWQRTWSGADLKGQLKICNIERNQRLCKVPIIVKVWCSG